MDVPHVWSHNFETKAQIKNLKTCGPSKWPPLTKVMPYSWVWNISIKKPRDNRKTGYRNIIEIREIRDYANPMCIFVGSCSGGESGLPQERECALHHQRLVVPTQRGGPIFERDRRRFQRQIQLHHWRKLSLCRKGRVKVYSFDVFLLLCPDNALTSLLDLEQFLKDSLNLMDSWPLLLSSRLQMCVNFRCMGNDYWDSNNGTNYVFQYFAGFNPSQSRPVQAPSPGDQNQSHTFSQLSNSPTTGFAEDPWHRYM